MTTSIDFKKQGDQFISTQNFLAAQNAYENALKLDSHYVNAAVSLGYALLEQGKLGEAEKALDNALKLSPDNADTHFMLSSIYEQQGQLDKAVKSLEAALTLNPQLEFAYRQLFQILNHTKQFQALTHKMQEALKAFPASIEFHFYLAQAYYSLKDYERAAREYRLVLDKDPSVYPALINLGNTYQELGQQFEAMQCYNKALALESDSFEAHLGLAKANVRAGYTDMALQHFDKCFTLNPKDAQLHVHYANTIFSQGNSAKAIDFLNKAIALEPDSVFAHHSLGNVYLELQNHDKAVMEYKKVLALEPTHSLSYLVAILDKSSDKHQSTQALETAPRDYVAQLFDEYAPRFETALVDNLKYNVPQVIDTMLKKQLSQNTKLDILDLGCGTGLSGEAVKDFVRTLVGVDLSSKMLEKAKQKNIYTRLEHQDITAMLSQEKPNTYDLVLCEDVFIYVGKLDAVMQEIAKVMRPGAQFAFSLESLDHIEKPEGSQANDKGFYLHTSGRYAHSLSYIQALSQQNNLVIQETLTQPLRLEKEKPVIGYILRLQKKV